MNNISQFDNPYLPPQTLATSPPPLPGMIDAEAIRREHIYTESTVQTIGALYYLTGTFLTLGGLIQGLNLFMGPVPTSNLFKDAMLFAFLTVFGVCVFALGREARKFNSPARIGIVLISVLGLFAIPVGTLINGYILCTVGGKKGRMVFSPEYKMVMATTPRPKVKTSPAVWVVLGIALLIIAVAVYFIVFGR